MDEKELTRAIEEGVCKAIKKEVKDFYVDREKHWDDHQFLGGFRRWIDETKSTVWKTIVLSVALGIIGLIVLGFAVWGGKN